MKKRTRKKSLRVEDENASSEPQIQEPDRLAAHVVSSAGINLTASSVARRRIKSESAALHSSPPASSVGETKDEMTTLPRIPYIVDDDYDSDNDEMDGAEGNHSFQMVCKIVE